MMLFIYVLMCCNDYIYVGKTKNINNRIKHHIDIGNSITRYNKIIQYGYGVIYTNDNGWYYEFMEFIIMWREWASKGKKVRGSIFSFKNLNIKEKHMLNVLSNIDLYKLDKFIKDCVYSKKWGEIKIPKKLKDILVNNKCDIYTFNRMIKKLYWDSIDACLKCGDIYHDYENCYK